MKCILISFCNVVGLRNTGRLALKKKKIVIRQGMHGQKHGTINVLITDIHLEN
jgi:hypothetical protein